MASTTQLDLPAMPLDVLELAGRENVAQELRTVVVMTRNVFRSPVITLRLEDDPEMADDRHIVIEVDVTGWTVDEMFAARNRWNQLFLKGCSPSKLCIFRLRLRQTA
jgi:hypothetical protein